PEHDTNLGGVRWAQPGAPVPVGGDIARLFVALALPPAVKDELGRAIGALEGSVTGARWVPAQNLHLTMAFLGRVEEERIGTLSSAIASAVQDHVDFTVRLGALGAFPSVRRARVIWAGPDDA